MKISKLLNKKYFSIILILFFGLSSYAEENPVDIWNIEEKQVEEESLEKNLETSKNKIQINENEDSIPQEPHRVLRPIRRCGAEGLWLGVWDTGLHIMLSSTCVPYPGQH